MGSNPSLEQSLSQLRLGTMRQHYDRLAEEATVANLSYDRYLQALVEQELSHRELQRQRRYVQQAHFPVLRFGRLVVAPPPAAGPSWAGSGCGLCRPGDDRHGHGSRLGRCKRRRCAGRATAPRRRRRADSPN